MKHENRVISKNPISSQMAIIRCEHGSRGSDLYNVMNFDVSFVGVNMPNHCMDGYRGIFSDDPIFVLHISRQNVSRHAGGHAFTGLLDV